MGALRTKKKKTEVNKDKGNAKCDDCDSCSKTRHWHLRLVHLRKALCLVVSPRTVGMQLICWICIYLLTAIPWLKENMITIGTATDIKALTMVLSLCLIFSVNQSFMRRERTLQDIASFKSHLTAIYFSLHQHKTRGIYRIVKDILLSLQEYMTCQNPLRDQRLHSHEQKHAMHAFYDDAYRLYQIIDADDKNNVNHSFLCRQVQMLMETFERIAATKDYSTPPGIKSFSTMMVYSLPIVLSPYFVWNEMPNRIEPYYGAYTWSYLYLLLFGALLDVKTKLDNIFDGEHHREDILIHVDEILEMIHSPTESAGYHEHFDEVQSHLSIQNGGSVQIE